MNAQQKALVRSTFELPRPIPRSAGLAFYGRARARGEAFLWTLGQVLGERFTPEVRAAWSEAYETLAAAMKQAAAEAREAGAAAKRVGPLAGGAPPAA